MNLLTETPYALPRSVSPEDGREGVTTAVLEVPVEWMRWCAHCESEQHFVAGWYSLVGLIGICLCCGDPALATYTRRNSEAA